MRIDLLSILYILYFSYITYGQDNQNNNNSNKKITSNNDITKIKDSSLLNNLQTSPANIKQDNNIQKNKSLSTSISSSTSTSTISNIVSTNVPTNVNEEAIINDNGLPKEIQEKLKGFFAIDKEEYNDKDKDNQRCMKTLLANIFYPTSFSKTSLKQYFNTVCNQQTNLSALKYLKEQIDHDNGNLCNSNGPNYVNLLNIIKLNYYMNCIKDVETGEYCYNYYEKLILNPETGNYYNKLGSHCNDITFDYTNEEKPTRLKQQLTYCQKITIFANKQLLKITSKDDINTEIYYDNDNIYKLSAKKASSVPDFLVAMSNCQGEKFNEYFLEHKNNNTLEYQNAKQLIDLGLIINDAKTIFINKKVFLLNITIIMFIAYHILV
ncbi:hypothetical protein BCR32DRAFT_328206 [Anaeromyces robustus]|uniref:Uncharacterized protein n=1 Tax=Anaeromyces robustus TaxID=1754192 RepID=A0A1Y1X0P3_9FUNG|nr:hypothetical protein BCR32DRAFT_328206 [Anaeromyces robustus]|eukprot:ORX79235.1 hypothetical protein BCR32DRAFT_328206 [Anaeromyces robustus]